MTERLFRSKTLRQHDVPGAPCDDVDERWRPTPREDRLLSANGHSRDQIAQRHDTRRLIPKFASLAAAISLAVVLTNDPEATLSVTLATAPWTMIPATTLGTLLYLYGEARESAYGAAACAALIIGQICLMTFTAIAMKTL